VGIEEYAFVEDVPGARLNAGDWHAYLTRTRGIPAEKVTLLRDKEATLEAMRRHLSEAASLVGEGGDLWFVFIGHGAPSVDGKDGFLVGVDAQQRVASILARSLSRNTLLKELAGGKQAKAVVVIDACFSGRTGSGHALVTSLQPLVTMQGPPPGADGRTILMTAAKANQFAGPLPRSQTPRPAFSFLVLGALRGWAANEKGRVTAGAAIDFSRKALRMAHGRSQTPELVTGQPKAVLATAQEPAPNLGRLDREGFRGAPEPPKAPQSEGPRTGIEWVTISGGSFMMGKTSPSHAVRVPRRVTVPTFQLAKTLVTMRQYKSCVAAGACERMRPCNIPDSFLGDDHPVVCVDWEQAQAFAKWVGGRLPSSAEWEYAARSGGKDRDYPWGNESADCDKAVIEMEPDLSHSRGGCGRRSTWPVCSKPKGNTLHGLCDMAGNAKEWVQDGSASWPNPDKPNESARLPPDYSKAPTDGSAWERIPYPKPPGTIEFRLTRGGSWKSPQHLTLTIFPADAMNPYFEDDIGFRPARTVR
jgi:formylglycine-generating enzyme required for sulfatase activity